MPALVLSGSTPHGAASYPALPLHLTPLTAAALESLIGGRHGDLTAAHLPALRELRRMRASDPDLLELMRVVDRHGRASVAFL